VYDDTAAELYDERVALLRGFERLCADPRTAAVAVEDSAHGTAAASAAGFDVVGYRTAANETTAFEDADVVVESADAVVEYRHGRATADS
jgi:beta-phosphoglucomutase-like phosphatase (HAD superfamily)